MLRAPGRLTLLSTLTLVLGVAPAEADGLRIALGDGLSCVLGKSVNCAGRGEWRLPADPAKLTDAAVVTFGLRHGCALARDGATSCWGEGGEGQLGVDPSAISRRRHLRPFRAESAAPPGVPGLSALDAGWLHTCGVAHTGAVVCWGDDDRSQLGRSGTPPPTAAPVDGVASVKTLRTGGLHTCALLQSGAVTCWGNGSRGQLGRDVDGDSAPALVKGLPSAATSIAAGGYHTCALVQGGDAFCWGDNRFGQLGDGSDAFRSEPRMVPGLGEPAVQLVAGTSFTCARLKSGDVRCWGSNQLGQLGIGSFAEPPREPAGSRPAARSDQVQGITAPAVHLSASGDHTCAVAGDGAVYCWGGNSVGQLGDGTATDQARAVRWQGGGARATTTRRPTLQGSAEGMDVSYHSGRIDWEAAAAAGHTFGMTLATAGVDFRDPMFSSHWEGMRRAGIVRGAYHYFVAADDPTEQARHFLAHVVPEPGDFVPVIDIESLGDAPPDDLADRLRAFIQTIEAALDVRPIVYTGPSFWNSHGSAGFGDYPLWIAEYGVSQPKVPKGWDGWHLWQWKGDAELPGIAADVDLNRLHPSAADDDLLVPDETHQRSANDDGG